MKITHIEDLHCDAGWREFSFLKIETDAGITGWSEYNESYGSGSDRGHQGLARHLIGVDPGPLNGSPRKCTPKPARARPGPTAIAALENALVDVKARALGVPVYNFWAARCTTVRSVVALWLLPDRSRRHGGVALTDLAGVEALGAEVRERGFTAFQYIPVRPRPAGNVHARLHPHRWLAS